MYKLPLLDNAGGSRLISYLKNSIMSASGLAVRFINILVTTLRFALAVLNLASPFLRSAGGLFINVYRLLFYVDWTEEGNSLQLFLS